MVSSTRPGEMVTIKITPEIYDISDNALSRFSYDERKCIVDSDISLNVTVWGISEYSQVNCLVSAMNEELNQNCKNDSETNFAKCTWIYAKQIGRWKYDKSSKKECLPSCKREVNIFVDNNLGVNKFHKQLNF